MKPERTKYIAPYFPLVQSSGMGKTRLFVEYKRMLEGAETKENFKCWTILCVDAGVPENDWKQYFDNVLIFKEEEKNDVQEIFDKMNCLVGNVPAKTKLVLLFDEAHALMTGIDGNKVKNLVFRAIRWWLRQVHANHIDIVAVFAGTTLKLSNFYKMDPPPTGLSRSERATYKNYDKDDAAAERDKIPYLPFFELHTISCLRHLSTPKEKSMNEFEQAVMYGRPMFAYYQSQNALDPFKKFVFMKRLVLSTTDFAENNLACYSVLGSRVQMGTLTSFGDTITVISSGYACLTDFRPVSENISGPQAFTAFLPDPFCAGMAMQLMDKKFQLDGVEAFHGKSRNFWTKKAKDAFSANLSRPPKGDVGEVFAVLYMLFCADVLREQNNRKSITQLSVPLNEWFQLLKNGGKATDSSSQKLSAGDGMRVSTIQFCQNHLRGKAFFDEERLKTCYLSGVGEYLYENCKAFDLMSAVQIKDQTEQQPSYHPLLVSVKHWSACFASDIDYWFKTMQQFLSEVRKGSSNDSRAICLLLLVGCRKIPQFNNARDFEKDSLPAVLSEDVFCLVCVPEKDKFGIDEAICELGLLSERSEVYASHAFMYTATSSSDMLCSKTKQAVHTSNLFNELKGIDSSPESKIKDDRMKRRVPSHGSETQKISKRGRK